MNAHAKVNKGFLNIEVDKWGIIKEAGADDQIKDEVNTANNHSEEEYELVPVSESGASKDESDTRGGRGRGRGGRGRGDRGRGERGRGGPAPNDDADN